MGEDVARAGQQKRNWRVVALYVGAAALWLILSIPPRESDDLAYYLGQILGGALVVLGVALAGRLVYWLARRPAVRFWSPWIFVIAAAVALVPRLADLGEATQRRDKAESLVADASGPKSKEIEECLTAAIASYETQSKEKREEVPFTKQEFEKVSVRYCQEMRERGLFDKIESGEISDAELPQVAEGVMADVIDEMRAKGELPPAPASN